MSWISVKERLPKNGQRCLIYDPSCHVGWGDEVTHIYAAHFEKGEHRPNGPWRNCDSGLTSNEKPWCWTEGANTWFSQDVTHWMPLPVAPDYVPEPKDTPCVGGWL